ncbi:MAG TPA: sulfotransferase [Acidimicrobiia bacterium]|jgi:hypothetical protein
MSEGNGLRVVGAGLGRTATRSLKDALELLLGGPCYHMMEVFPRPEHIGIWTDAAEGKPVDWPALFDGFVAAVDWPTCAFWREISDVWPDSLILLSTRTDAAAWFTSADATIFNVVDDGQLPPEMQPFRIMWDAIATNTFTPNFRERDAAMAAYDAHNAAVRAEADPARLVEWQARDGWEPLCAALGVPVPDVPFPHLNTTEEWLQRDGPPDSVTSH